MNISMLDMYSLAWKINLVEKGVGKAEILLPTYEHERRSVAQELLKFDSAYSRLFSGRNPSSNELTDDQSKAKKLGAVDAEKFIEAFKSNVSFNSMLLTYGLRIDPHLLLARLVSPRVAAPSTLQTFSTLSPILIFAKVVRMLLLSIQKDVPWSWASD